MSNESGTCPRGRAWRLPEGCREVCEAPCREGPCGEGTEGCGAPPRSDAVRQWVHARCAVHGASAVQARCSAVRGAGAVQARCRRGAGAVQARWATHLERGDGHVGVALPLTLTPTLTLTKQVLTAALASNALGELQRAAQQAQQAKIEPQP